LGRKNPFQMADGRAERNRIRTTMKMRRGWKYLPVEGGSGGGRR
jgi:hypothetical protein